MMLMLKEIWNLFGQATMNAIEPGSVGPEQSHAKNLGSGVNFRIHHGDDLFRHFEAKKTNLFQRR